MESKLPKYRLSQGELDALVAEIGPELRDLEDQRVDLLARRQQYLWLALAIVAVSGLISFALFRARGPVGLIGVLAGGIGLYVAHRSILGDAGKDYQTGFKFTVVRTICKSLYPQMDYMPLGGLSEQAFMQTQLFGTSPDRYSTEDQLVGRIGKTEVELAEVHAEERKRRTDSKGRSSTYYVDIFRGILFVADFHKHFRGVTRIMPDNEKSLFRGLGEAIKIVLPFESKQAVRMADPEFENHFKVFSTDHVEAHYLLPPSMQQRIRELRSAWGDVPIRLSFVDSKVSVAIPTRENLLDSNPKKTLEDGKEIRRVAEELKACLGLVEDLALNTRIWSKD